MTLLYLVRQKKKHNLALNTVLEKLKQNNFKINAKKIQLKENKIKILGATIDSHIRELLKKAEQNIRFQSA